MKPEELKRLRTSLGLSSDKAAQQVHVATRTWARYESGDRAIPEGVIELFCIKNNIKYDGAKSR